jgi:hypothetical protein
LPDEHEKDVKALEERDVLLINQIADLRLQKAALDVRLKVSHNS